MWTKLRVLSTEDIRKTAVIVKINNKNKRSHFVMFKKKLNAEIFTDSLVLL